nr:putative wrky transcription factor 19 [Ipomoea batatas]
MDPRFHSFGFAANLSLNAYNNLGNPIQIGGAGVQGGYCADTTLRLDSLGSLVSSISSPKGIKRKWSLIDGPANEQVGSSLCLRLGHSSSSSESKGGSSGTATVCTSTSSTKESDDESSMDLELDFTLHLGNEKSLSPKKSASCEKEFNMPFKVDLELSLSSGPSESGITTAYQSSTSPHSSMKLPETIVGVQIDEGSMSSSLKSGCFINPLQTPNSARASYANQAERQINSAPISHDPCSSAIANLKSSVTCSSGVTKQKQQHQQRSSSSSKKCQFQGCVKGARGASGLCIAHGGGRRCQKSGCHKGAEGRTAFCKAHGGGRRCEFLGCTKSAEGRTDFCIAHGGGRRCSYEGCARAARGKSGLCIRHGGGKRCQKENCTKSAEGLSGLCISHGGGRRCQYPQCTKGAQGSTMFCKAHGGGKRCSYEGCTKGAEGSTPFCKGHGGGKRCLFQGGGVCPKSVHGGTLYCVAHGGGKRCAVTDCTKSARGRTDFCVRHGGGKRCKFEGCGKSAQGSTEFCKAHGGGKRCSWGQPGSEFGIGDGPCNSLTRGKTGLCASHSALVQDKRVHGGATIGVIVQDTTPNKPEKLNNTVSHDDMNVDTIKMETSVLTSQNSSSGKCFGLKQASMPVRAPEGRVHGGILMALLTNNNSGLSLGNNTGMVNPSEPGKTYTVSQNWM